MSGVRYHDGLFLHCIFVCVGCEDYLDHYFVCPLFWKAIAAALGRPCGDSVPGKFGLIDLSAMSLPQSAIVYATYHAFNNDPVFRNASALSRSALLSLWDRHAAATVSVTAARGLKCGCIKTHIAKNAVWRCLTILFHKSHFV